MAPNPAVEADIRSSFQFGCDSYSDPCLAHQIDPFVLRLLVLRPNNLLSSSGVSSPILLNPSMNAVEL